MERESKTFETIDILDIIDEIEIKARIPNSKFDPSHPEHETVNKILGTIERNWAYVKVDRV